MPDTPAVLEAVAAVREAMPVSGIARVKDYGMARALRDLFRDSEVIAESVEAIEAVLALAPELEALRGMGSQRATLAFADKIIYLTDLVAVRVRQSARENANPSGAAAVPNDAIKCLEKLAAHAYARTALPKVRTFHGDDLRIAAWQLLTSACEELRRPEHLAWSLQVAGDPQAAFRERRAAIEFLVIYWQTGEPDEATATLLKELEKNAPDREFLMTVLHAQVDLGLTSDWGAMAAAAEWDEAQDE